MCSTVWNTRSMAEEDSRDRNAVITGLDKAMMGIFNIRRGCFADRGA